jgi:hypothetical protein
MGTFKLFVLTLAFCLTGTSVCFAEFIDDIYRYNVATQPRNVGKVEGTTVVAGRSANGAANFGPFQTIPAVNRPRRVIGCAELRIEEKFEDGTQGAIDIFERSTGQNPSVHFSAANFSGVDSALFCVEAVLPAGRAADVELRWFHFGRGRVRLLNKFLAVVRDNVFFVVSNQQTVTLSGESGPHIIAAVNGMGQPEYFKIIASQLGISVGARGFFGILAADIPDSRKRGVSTERAIPVVFLVDHQVVQIKPRILADSLRRLGGAWPAAVQAFFGF